MSNKLFGQILSEGIRSVSICQNRSIAGIEGDIAQALGYTAATVQRWRKGYIPDNEAYVEFLARYVVQNGKRGRTWLNHFLTQARYYDRQRLLEGLCPEPVTPLIVNKAVPQNLPPRSGEFLGRQEAMALVIEGLTSRWPLISIEGMGGIGKTTLAVEAARACLLDGAAGLNEPFEACVFVSAKDQPILLNDLLEIIARVLNYPYIIHQTPSEQRPIEVDHLLRTRRVLIVADNFETVTDKTLVDYLLRVPEPSKVLITTRHSQLRRVWDIPLKGLPENEALELIRRHAHRRRLLTVAQAKDETLKPLVVVTGGNPYALETALGYLKYGHLALDSLVNALYQAGYEVHDIFDYIFDHAWALLPQDARHLLMAMSFFIESASKDALGATAAVEGFYLDRAIGQLVEMSLLEVNDALEERRRRYRVHPLTLVFAGARSREIPTWEQEAREHWSDYYLHYVELYGDNDLGEAIGGGKAGHREKLRDEIENIRIAIEWSFHHRPKKAVWLVERITTFLLDEGEWSARLDLCQRALEVAQTPESMAGLLTRLGWSHFDYGDYEQARKAQEKGLEIAQQHGLQHRLVQLLRDLGYTYFKQGDYSLAHRLYDQSLKLAESIGDELGMFLAKAFRARTVYQNNHYTEAKQDFLDLLLEFKRSYLRDVDFVLRHLAHIAIQEKRFDEARDYLREATERLHIYYEVHEEGQLYESWGDLERECGNWNKASEAYDKALDLATRLGAQKEIERLHVKLHHLEEHPEAQPETMGSTFAN